MLFLRVIFCVILFCAVFFDVAQNSTAVLLADPPNLQQKLTGIYDLDSVFTQEHFVAAPTDFVQLRATYREDFLLLHAKIRDGWHLYSLTQPDGGPIRSEIRVKNSAIPIRCIRPSVAPTLNLENNGFNIPLQEHAGTLTWLVQFEEPLPRSETISGALYAQFCQDVCIPPAEYPFEATYDPNLDIKAALLLADKVATEFTYTPGELPNDVNRSDTTDRFQPREAAHVSFIGMVILYAFLGGLILNVMPCVLPVIGLKILSFFEQAGKNRRRAFLLNASYSVGLLSVFWILAALNLGLSRLFSFDLFSIVMACVGFMMALSLMEVWQISMPNLLGRRQGQKPSRDFAESENFFGAYFKGIITTLLAIPCGAPLLSPAISWADIQIRAGNTPLVFLTYSVIGLGMAAPYLLLGAFPELLRFLPKPGAWMETFKKTMGFLLLACVIWILYFIRLERMLPTLTLLFSLWFACWMIGKLDYSAMRRIRVWFISLVTVSITIAFSFPVIPANPYTLENAVKAKINRVLLQSSDFLEQHGKKHWTLYSPERLQEALVSGKPILVDFTADWCVACSFLETIVLHSPAVLDKMNEKNVVSFVADRTYDGAAKDFLRQLGPDSVPALAIFDPKNPNEPVVLRGLYTRKQLLDILDRL